MTLDAIHITPSDQLIVVVIPMANLSTLTEAEAAIMVNTELFLRADRLLIQRDDTYEEIDFADKNAEWSVVPRPSMAESLRSMIEAAKR